MYASEYVNLYIFYHVNSNLGSECLKKWSRINQLGTLTTYVGILYHNNAVDKFLT